MTQSDPLVIRSRNPPPAVMAVVNPVVRRLAAAGRLGGQILVLHHTGRRTGRRYDVPVGYHPVDGVPTVFTTSGWRHNYADGPVIEVTYRGTRRPTRAELVTDVDRVAAVYAGLIERFGRVQAQRRLGIRITVDRTPTREEVATAVAASGLAMVRLPGLADAGA